MKKIFIICSSIVLCLILGIVVISYSCTSIKLNGEKVVEINYGDEYVELGASGSFFNMPLSVLVNNDIEKCRSYIAYRNRKYSIIHRSYLYKRF